MSGMIKLHPGARWMFRINGFFSVFALVIFLSIFGFSILVPLMGELGLKSLVMIVISLIVAFILLVVIFTEVYARLSYNNWFYEIGDSNIRLERGIIWKRYSNIPYDRVQNIDIHRGILARMFGFSSLLIQTAGYSMPMRGSHAEGSIPAVDMKEAEQIREYILKKIHKKNQGL